MEELKRNFRRKSPFRSANIRLAYDLTPWRIQVQAAGSVMLAVVVIALVAGFYLSVSTRTAAIGRQIQNLQVRMSGPVSVRSYSTPTPTPAPGEAMAPTPKEEDEIVPIEELRMSVADLQVQLAELTSEKALAERARALGFEPITPDALDSGEVIYLPVIGYQPYKEAQLAPPPALLRAPQNPTVDLYRDSLFEAFQRNWQVFVDTTGWEAIP